MEVANTDALTPGAPTIANVTRAPGFTWMAAPASVSDFVAGLLQMNNRNSIVGLQHHICAVIIISMSMKVQKGLKTSFIKV